MSSHAQNNNNSHGGGASTRGRARGQSRSPAVASAAGGDDVDNSRRVQLPQLPADMVRLERERIVSLADRRAAASTAAPKSLSMARFLTMTSLVQDPLWQRVDTIQLDATTKAFCNFVGSKRLPHEFESLWRLVPRIMRCTPPDLFEGRHLRCAESATIDGTVVPSPVWSERFSIALRVLIFHPFFDRSPGLLALTLQYAVKLRTNDRRHWPLVNPTDSRFVDDMASAFGTPHPSHKTADIHEQVRQAMQWPDDKKWSLVSAVFKRIEVVARPAQTVFSGSTAPFAPYAVTVDDLKNVAVALDNVASCGNPLWAPSEYTATFIRTAWRGYTDPPHKREGVIEAMVGVHKRHIQLGILEQRRAAASQGSGGVPVQLANTATATAMGGAGSSNNNPAALSAASEEIRRLEDENERLKAKDQERQAEIESLMAGLARVQSGQWPEGNPIVLDDDGPAPLPPSRPPSPPPQPPMSPPPSAPVVDLQRHMQSRVRSVSQLQSQSEPRVLEDGAPVGVHDAPRTMIPPPHWDLSNKIR